MGWCFYGAFLCSAALAEHCLALCLAAELHYQPYLCISSILLSHCLLLTFTDLLGVCFRFLKSPPFLAVLTLNPFLVQKTK